MVSGATLDKKMPRRSAAAFGFKVLFVDGLRSVEDAAEDGSDAVVAKNVPDAVVTVALVSVRVLAIAFVIAAYEAVTKSLRGGVLVVARTLRAVTLATLAITGASVQAGLVSLVQLDLIPVVVAIVVVATVVAITIVVIATVIAVATVAISTIIVISTIAAIAISTVPGLSASPLAVLSFVLTLFPLLGLLTIAVALTLVPTIIIPILRVSGKAGRCGYAKNKSERQTEPANFSSKIFHICRFPLFREEGWQSWGRVHLLRFS